jgi:hypothetical protein
MKILFRILVLNRKGRYYMGDLHVVKGIKLSGPEINSV